MDRRRIAPYDRKRWFQIHCCRSVVKVDPLPLPDIGMALGLVMTGLIAVLAIGVLIHLMSAPAAAGILVANVALPVGLQELQGKLDHVLGQYKELKEQAQEMEKKYGTLPTTVTEQLAAMQKQLDAIDVKLAEKHSMGGEQKSLEQILSEDLGLKTLRENKRGMANVIISGKNYQNYMEHKTTIDRAAAGFPTPGVLQIDRTPGVVLEARQAVQMRNVLPSRPTNLGMIDFVKVNSAQAAASMQTESSAKVENALTFTTASAKVETIASWIPASRQVLDDWAELAAIIDNALRYAVDQREDIELLFGNGASPDLNGLYTQATAFDTALLTPLSPGYTKSDTISCAIQQIQIAKEISPTFVVLHPTDYWNIWRTKDINRNYIFGGMNGKIDPFWGLLPIITTFMTSGQFLVGSGNPAAAEIRDRMAMEVSISTEHQDFFVKNLVAVRAEKREALVVYRPASFIKGTLVTSP